MLFTTGYLTYRSSEENDVYSLVIPNLEIQKIFREQVMEWFQEETKKDTNIESGEGFSDIQVEIEEEGVGIVIELKYPDNGNLEAGCAEAIKQIEDIGYEERLREDGMTKIIKYGIACWKKGVWYRWMCRRRSRLRAHAGLYAFLGCDQRQTGRRSSKITGTIKKNTLRSKPWKCSFSFMLKIRRSACDYPTISARGRYVSLATKPSYFT